MKVLTNIAGAWSRIAKSIKPKRDSETRAKLQEVRDEMRRHTDTIEKAVQRLKAKEADQ